MAVYRLTQDFYRIEAVGTRGTLSSDPADPVRLTVRVQDDADASEVEAVVMEPNTRTRLYRAATGKWVFLLNRDVLQIGRSYTVKWHYEMIRGVENMARKSFVFDLVPEVPHSEDACIVAGNMKDLQGLPVADQKLVVEQYADIVTQTKRTSQQIVTTDTFGNWWIELPHGALTRFVLGELTRAIRVPKLAFSALGDIPELKLKQIVRLDRFGYPYPGETLEEGWKPEEIVVAEPSELEVPAQPGIVVLSALNDSDTAIRAGMPVAASGAGVVRALASGLFKRAYGVAITDADPGLSVNYVVSGTVTRSDWTAVVGTAHLVPSRAYYLSPNPGQLQDTLPLAPAVTYQQLVGEAISATTLRLAIGLLENAL
jgi:hypothetical protein